MRKSLIALIVFACSVCGDARRPHAKYYDDQDTSIAHTMGPNPKPYRISYDDGTESPPILLRVKGEGSKSKPQMVYEETLDGYTVRPSKLVGRNGSPYYVYVDVNATSGDLINTNLIAGIDDPYKFRIPKEAASRRYTILLEKLKRQQPDNDTSTIRPRAYNPIGIKKGLLKNLAVAFRFSDHTNRPLPSKDDLDTLMNHHGPHTLCPTGSVRDVYLQSSFNKLDVKTTVVGWVDIRYTESFCANGESGIHSNFFKCLHDALDEVAKLGIDFQDFDINDDGSIDSITFFHSGYAAEYGGVDAYGAHVNNRIWSHKWIMWTGSWNNNGVEVDTYNVNPAVWAISGSNIGRIGVVSHEIGHFLGLPDLYDYGDDVYGSGEGIGSFGLMANSWGFDGEQYHPPLMSAWSKYKLGYVEPIIADASGSYSVRQACDNPDMILINSGFARNEYLLIENRQACGFDSKIPGGGGLAIFHIDDFSNNVNGHPFQDEWPMNKNHYQVALLQADGNYDLERGNNRGDGTDLFRAGYVDFIGPDGLLGSSHPNTNGYKSGTVRYTGIRISNISESGAVMTFDISLENGATKSPTAAPVSSPVAATTDSPSAAPVSSPVAVTTYSPSAAPVSSPVAVTTDSPSAAPVSSPVAVTTYSPSAAPVVSPVVSPVAATTYYPSAAPVSSPVAVTTYSPSAAPVVSPEVSPVAATTYYPSAAPVSSPLAATATDSPTTTPVSSPVSAPTFNSECQDSAYRLKIEESGMISSRSCSWVARRNTKTRCNIIGVSETCAKTCGSCGERRDSTLRFKFVFEGAYLARSCDWTRRRDVKKRCSISGMVDTCRYTCNDF